MGEHLDARQPGKVQPAAASPAETGAQQPSGRLPAPQRGIGLTAKLVIVTIVFVMAIGIASFVPSLAAFRQRFLEDRLTSASAASVLLNSSIWSDVPRKVQDDLLSAVGATAIVVRTGPATRLLATVEMPPTVDETADLRVTDTLARSATPSPRCSPAPHGRCA